MVENEKDYGFMLKVQKAYEASLKAGEGSVRAVATQLNISRTKVRKILVTLGVIQSDITEQAKKLKESGLSISEIADRLGISMATVSTYLPYETVIYNGEEKSPNAIHIERYRDRLKNISDSQVHHSNKNAQKHGENEHMRERDIKIYRLHLELDTDGADMEALRKHGRVKNGISRDILVSSDMTLHSLHYVIQRAFGWQNSHLHHFELPSVMFSSLTKGNFKRWADYCGIYFRFPSEDMEDLYWDDDYNGSVSIRTWLRKKYTGPYLYHGISEHFMEARSAVLDFIRDNEELSVAPPFEQWMKMTEEERKTPIVKRIDEITCDEIDMLFGSCGTRELLERLKLSEIFAEEDVKAVPESIINKAEASYNDNHSRFIKLHNAMINGDDYAYWQEMNKINGKTQPITKTLCYQYDYGDGWEVKINVTDVFYCDTTWDHSNQSGWMTTPVTDEDNYDDLTPLYQNGEMIEDEVLAEQIRAVVMGYRPLCVVADGLPVLDDVGGIGGYAELLKALHGTKNSSFENAEDAIEWANSMGWTGRMNKPEKML